MRKFFATYFHSLAGGIIVTFLLAYPQAQVVGAPDRGFMASSVTLAIFFGIVLAGLLVVSVAITRIGILGFAKIFSIQDRVGRKLLALMWGGAGICVALLLSPFGDNPLDNAGFLAAWVVISGFGATAAEEKFGSMTSMMIMVTGILISVGAGLAVLAVFA